MAAPQETYPLTFASIKTVEREGKKPYYKVRFGAPYHLGEYQGNEATLWSDTGKSAVDVLIAAPREVHVTIQSSEQHPDWSGSIQKIVDPANGATLYEPEQRKGGRDGWKGGKGQGDWETHDERAFRSASIESQVAAKVLADHVPEGTDPADYIEANVGRIALAIREAAKAVAKAGGYPAKVATAVTAPAAAPPAPPAPPMSAPGGPGSSESVAALQQPPGADPSPQPDVGELKNAALKVYANIAGVQAAYLQAYGEAKPFREITEGELRELIDLAQLAEAHAGATA